MNIEKGQADRLFPGTTAILNQDAADVRALGINQTPTFFLNGRRLDNSSLGSLMTVVRAAVNGVS